jgi:hypothetical protein
MVPLETNVLASSWEFVFSDQLFKLTELCGFEMHVLHKLD